MRLLRFLRRVFTSRLALALVSLNLVLCLYVLVNRPPVDVDFGYESWLFTILFIINLPASVISLVPWGLGVYIFILAGYEEMLSGFARNLFQVFVALLCASLQWALIGYGIEKLLQRRKEIKNSRFS